jgi:alpha-ketoglutarate-dependent taurine dioxygenase
MSSEIEIVVQAPPDASAALGRALADVALEDMENVASAGLSLDLEDASPWQWLAQRVWDVYLRHEHVVLRGLEPAADARTLMAAASILGKRFLTYGEGQVIKIFTMSPWSRGLAHVGLEGFFHTDLNASPVPPALTGIQCVKPDPGAPDYGFNRVARLGDLLDYLRAEGEVEAVAFMTEQEVEMANERSPTSWRGRIASDDILRFHPETIRAASRRRGEAPPDLILEAIQRAAKAVSVPISLERGDILLFSNHRTLHYRSECSISFIRFPIEFEARQIHVLHVRDEHLRT